MQRRRMAYSDQLERLLQPAEASRRHVSASQRSIRRPGIVLHMRRYPAVALERAVHGGRRPYEVARSLEQLQSGAKRSQRRRMVDHQDCCECTDQIGTEVGHGASPVTSPDRAEH